MKPLTLGIAVPLIIALIAFSTYLVLHEPAPLPIAEASGKVIGKVTYEGRTTSSYNGNMGGFDGVNAKCNSQYPGSHVCTQGEIIKSGTTSIPGAGWAMCDLTYIETGCWGVVGGLLYTIGTHYGCDGYTYNTSLSSGGGPGIDATGALIEYDCRSTVQPIHCCS